MSGTLVGIVMGSDSDLPVMKLAAEALEELSVGWELVVASAHRTPDRAAAYAREAASRGLRVIIAGAGAAAHLPGVLASYTSLPVIGVPMASTPLAGADALHAIVQMPPGVPVATVAVNGARNAGLLAAQILAIGMPDLAVRLREQRSALAASVDEKNRRLQERLTTTGLKGVDRP
ncbi:MAG: 5-(carboxyamino)imidazole ribonucleotide mutase [Firmicutes bacterium]|nr:5-(carboxyamino)imidazole ribonucleotide mutase [Bacillota bacterium]